MLMDGFWKVGGALALGRVVGIPMAYLTGRLRPCEPIQAEALGLVILTAGLAEWLGVSYILSTIVVGTVADGKVAAAGLDVLPDEPAISEEAELIRSFFDKKHDLETLFVNHVLLQVRNVLITPHSAFNTKEAVERILATTGDNIMGFVSGKPVNLVNNH